MHENGLVPTNPVFGSVVISVFPIIDTDLSNPDERKEVIETLAAIMNEILVKQHTRTALAHELSPAADQNEKVRERFFNYSKIIKKLIGQLRVVCT